MFEACQAGKTKIVKLLLENYNCEDSGKEIIPETDEETVQIRNLAEKHTCTF